MITMTLKKLAEITGGQTTHPTISFEGLCKDNRNVTAGNLFVAIKGENHDGQQFVDAAFQSGAAAALVNQKINSSIPQIIVKDTILALGQIAQYWREQFPIPLIGVTGSNGKTTLKNMIASILLASQKNKNAVLATEGNLNNTIGLPFTLAKLNAEHRVGVIEMGMNIPGEIEYLTKITHPQVAIVNNAAESHLAGVKNLAGVAKEKGDIFLGLDANGIAILNRDDQFYDYWLARTKNFKRITFGLDNSADVTAANIQQVQHRQEILMQTPIGNIIINLPLLGRHNVMNALAACAATIALDIDINDIKAGLENVKPAKGRFTPHVFDNGFTLIDDSYNANPFSTHAAIKTLATFAGNKILVLGDMRELGEEELALHTLTGERAKEVGINYVFTFGELTKATSQAFGENAKHFITKDELVRDLQPFLEKNNTILVKGSLSMKMDEAVAKLLALMSPAKIS